MECDVSRAIGYKSLPQISRILSEAWFGENGYCLSCNSDQLLTATIANTKASDFACGSCEESYELKAFRVKPTRKLIDGAYGALISRIQSGSVPNLVMLERNETWQIQSLTAIHHLFLTPEVVERRKPLSVHARRAGWVGCNIRLDMILPEAQIQIVKAGVASSRKLVRESFRRFDRLKSIPPNLRGWTTLTLAVIRSLKQPEFSLKELYAKELLFASSYPKNNNIRAKMRQQLQVLRDLGYLEFCGQGRYQLLL